MMKIGNWYVRRNQAKRQNSVVRRGWVFMFFNNLCGKNFSGEKYRDYIKYIAFGEMGFKPGEIMLYRNGTLVRTGKINIEK
jgi:hypothetical protein